MRYPQFYEMYRNSVRSTWTVEEVDFQSDINDLRNKMTPAERHLIERLVAFFATGDSIVSNNLVLNLYVHINSPEGRMYLSRQLGEEALHVQFYLTLLDTYMPEAADREKAFAAVENIPSIKAKAEFMFAHMNKMAETPVLRTKEDRQNFVFALIVFAGVVEGLFFFAAFAYVYYLRSRGLCSGLAAGTAWVFRDETAHMNFAFAVLDIVREEEPDLFDHTLEDRVRALFDDAIECETQFAKDVLQGGVVGMSVENVREYLQYVANQRIQRLGYAPRYKAKNPFPFMELQDVQEHSNFFERRVTAYQVGVSGDVKFDADF